MLSGIRAGPGLSSQPETGHSSQDLREAGTGPPRLLRDPAHSLHIPAPFSLWFTDSLCFLPLATGT